MFNCTHCGHADYAHTNFVGPCIHGQMKPKDGLDCDCPGMDRKPSLIPSGGQS